MAVWWLGRKLPEYLVADKYRVRVPESFRANPGCPHCLDVPEGEVIVAVRGEPGESVEHLGRWFSEWVDERCGVLEGGSM